MEEIPRKNLHLGIIFLFLFLFGVSTYQLIDLKNEVKEIKNKIEAQNSIIPEPTIPSDPPGQPTPIPDKTPIEVVGAIQYSDVEGGCWFIRADSPQCNGDRCSLGLAAPYVPVNLVNELKTAGIKASFKLEMLPDTATTCQIGPAVKILNYKIRN